MKIHYTETNKIGDWWHITCPLCSFFARWKQGQFEVDSLGDKDAIHQNENMYCFPDKVEQLSNDLLKNVDLP